MLVNRRKHQEYLESLLLKLSFSFHLPDLAIAQFVFLQLPLGFKNLMVLTDYAASISPTYPPSLMTKHQLALMISRQIYKGRGLKERFNVYQSIQSYFSMLSIEDLICFASKYGINLKQVVI